MVADLLQQGRFAVASGLLQQLDQRVFQCMIARRQRDEEQLWIEADRVLRLPPLHRRAKGVLMFLRIGRASTGQPDAQNRITPQATGEEFAPQHAAQADEDVIGGCCVGFHTAAVEQVQFDAVVAAHDPGLEMSVEKRKEAHEILAGAVQ
ncbi:hypothetical protein D3C71_1664260 [compost metagenome]